MAAWDVISRYNDALLALAEGQNAKQLSGSFTALGQSIETFAGSLGSSIPGLGAVFNVANTILAAVEKGRVREEFARALKEGEPIITKIIDFFIYEKNSIKGKNQIEALKIY